MSPLKEKILIVLNAGVQFSYHYHSGGRWDIIKNAYYKWHNINYLKLKEELDYLYRSQYIQKVKNKDGSFSIFLTKKGRIKAVKCHFPQIKKGKWDKKWRMVIFDVPEHIHNGRNALRQKLKEIGFRELQHSVLIFPYECEKEIKTIVSFFEMDKYVRYGILEYLDNHDEMKKKFSLT